MKAIDRDKKIAAAKARDAEMIEALPESYRPKREIRSTRESQVYAHAVISHNAEQMRKQEKREQEEKIRQRNAEILLEKNMILLPGDTVNDHIVLSRTMRNMLR